MFDKNVHLHFYDYLSKFFYDRQRDVYWLIIPGLGTSVLYPQQQWSGET